MANLLFLKCPCTVTLALGLIGKSNQWTLRDTIAHAVLVYSDKCAMMIITKTRLLKYTCIENFTIKK